MLPIIRMIGVTLVIVIISTSRPVIAQSGVELYEQKCGRCHVAYKPAAYSKEQWPGIVRSMKVQATLSSQDIEELTNYLTSASEESESNSASGEPIVGGYLYTEYFRTQEKTINFDIHYLAFSATGWINDKIAYLGEFELEHGGTGGNNTFVEQAYIDFWVRRNIAVKVGAILTPFNRFDEFHDPLENHLVTRPQLSREIGVSAWKDVGVDLHGYFNLNPQNSLTFDIYAINGLGSGKNLRGSRQYRDNNEELGLGARVNFIHKELIEIGLSGYRGAWDDGGKYDVSMVGAHFMLNTELVDIYAEYTTAESENPPVDTLGNPQVDGDMSGYFIQLTRLFDRKYRTTVRIGGLDYLDSGAALGRTPTNKELTELAIGFTYYPASKVSLKAEYTAFEEGDRVTQKDNNQLGLQAAVKF